MTAMQEKHLVDEIPAAQFEFDREVRLVDTDATGFAHFATYVRMMEETEYAFLRSRGLSVVLYDERGTLGFPRLSVSLQIDRPLELGEQVTVKLMLVQVNSKQVNYKFSIIDATGAVAVEGHFRAACCRFPADRNPYAILMPDHVLKALQTEPVCSSDVSSVEPAIQ